jgi:hypothetical protein
LRSPPLIAMRLECGKGPEVHDKGEKTCRQLQGSGGGSKASKGKVAPADKRNENSSAKGR